jgi:hypothetical protein
MLLYTEYLTSLNNQLMSGLLVCLLLSLATHTPFKALKPKKFAEAFFGGGFEVNPAGKSGAQRGCSEVLDEDLDNALLDYEDARDRTSGGTYRCRDCGRLFDTLEAHDWHRRKVHLRTEKYPLESLPM